MRRICYTILIVALLILNTAVHAEILSQWQVNTENASDPLVFSADIDLHLLTDMGPVFVDGEDLWGPQDYTTQVTAVTTKDQTTTMQCRAFDDEFDFSAKYTLQFTPLPDGAMEMIVTSDDVVTALECGTITGTAEPFKQFHLGQRDVECYASNDGHPPIIYWPETKVYIHAHWDPDSSHAINYSHRLPPKQHFIAANPPVSCDLNYTTLTDGTRPKLHERYVFRVATDLWQAYPPVTQNPSEYRQELSEMVFNDIWASSLATSIFQCQWLKDVTAGRIPFYTIRQQWGYAGFDDSLPDFYHPQDYPDPCPRFGTHDQLQELMTLANSIGRAGLRCNYFIYRTHSPSYQKGLFKPQLKPDGSPKRWTNFHSIIPLIQRQENDIHNTFNTTAVFHDQWGSGGYGGYTVNCDANSIDAGTVSGVRKVIRDICSQVRQIHQGPLSSESLNGEYLIGEFLDTGDFQIFGADHRCDFTPEYKLRRLHQLTMTHSMGLGYRFFFGPWESEWGPGGQGREDYFDTPLKQDSYRACEILYGNGGYLFYYDCMSLGHALTECFTVGLVQRYYGLQPVDYVKYAAGRRWREIDFIISRAKSIDDVHAWFKRFHIRYANGCHVYVNRDTDIMEVLTTDNRTFRLPQNGWLVYTEDGTVTAYTALVIDPVVAGFETRVDFAEDTNRGIRYANPRKANRFMGVSAPTVWLDGNVHYVLENPETTFSQAAQPPAQ